MAKKCVFVSNPRGAVHAVTPEHAAQLVARDPKTLAPSGYVALGEGTDPRESKSYQEKVNAARAAGKPIESLAYELKTVTEKAAGERSGKLTSGDMEDAEAGVVPGQPKARRGR